MNGPSDTTSSQPILLTPRTSLQNIGEKRDKDEAERDGSNFQAFGPDGFTFLDFLDIINPLQHIPIVNTLYRELSGDEIDPGSRIAGGTLFGGPIGTVVAMANIAVEDRSGKDMGEHMMALFGGREDEGVAPADFVTAAGDGGGESAAAASPITANAEVLEWARRETSRAAMEDDQAGAKTRPAGSVDIAANIEVLNWARREAAWSGSTSATAAVAAEDKRVLVDRQDNNNRQAAIEATFAVGRDQTQLSGATAPMGGWFSETMLLALARYDESAKLGKSGVERQVEETTNRGE